MSVVKSQNGGITWKSSGPKSFKTVEQMEAEIKRLRGALIAIMPYTATQSVGCHGFKCRESWCYSCNDEDEAEGAANAGRKAYQIAIAALQAGEGE